MFCRFAETKHTNEQHKHTRINRRDGSGVPKRTGNL